MSDIDDELVDDSDGDDAPSGFIDFTNPRAGWLLIAGFTIGIIALGLLLT